MTAAHDSCLMAIDAVHMAAQQIVSEAEQAATVDAYRIALHVRAIREQLRELEQSLAEAAPYAEAEESRVLNR